MKIRQRFSIECTVVCIGLLMLIPGIALVIFSPDISQYLIDKSFVLSADASFYPIWERYPEELNLDIYFFNWTNPEEIYDLTKKVKLQQLGPYRFKETRTKSGVEWPGDDTVIYRNVKTWRHDPENSVGSLDDQLTTVDIITATMAKQLQSMGHFAQIGASLFLDSTGRRAHTTHTVGEFMFQGYEDTLIEMARSLPSMDGIKIPPVDRIGFFYGRNTSDSFEGLFRISRGSQGPTMGQLLSWNEQTDTGFFEGSCGKVEGTAGEFFPRNLKKDYVRMFTSDLCRHADYEFESEEIVKGIMGYKFSGGRKMLDNGTYFEENKCFCGENCVPNGALDVSTCRSGAPAVVSFPHFFGADSFYFDKIEGLQPDKEKHQFFITLEPNTGIPLEVAARIQISFRLTNNTSMGIFKNVPEIHIPIIWFEQRTQLMDSYVEGLRVLLNVSLITRIVGGCFAVLGLIILVSGAISIIYTRKRMRATPCLQTEEVPLKNVESDSKKKPTVKTVWK